MTWPTLGTLALVAGLATSPALFAQCRVEVATTDSSMTVAPPQGVVRRARVRRQRSDREAGNALVVVEGQVRTMQASRLIDAQFVRFDPHYVQARADRRSRLDALKIRLDAAQHPGRWLYCSQQLYDDAEWLIEYSAHWDRADDALSMLDRSLEVSNQASANAQAADGSWGGCRREWIFRLDRTLDAFNAMSPSPIPRLAHPLAFLQRIDKPAAIGHVLFSRAVSAIAATGIYGREEQSSLNESLPQLLFKPALVAIARANGAGFMDPLYVDRYARLIDAMQDPVTGFWGAVLLADGERISLPDLSMTFHLVSYRKGCVALWPQIFETLLAMKSTDYPHGWLSHGRVTTHNAYDVVRIMRLGWHKARPDQQARARADVAALLEEALSRAVRPDGSVAFDPDYYETEAAAYYFAAAFLDEVGYWRRDRFWTSDSVVRPQALALCRAMSDRVRMLQGESALAVGALQRLAANCP
jgi:hypothetical protein